MNHPLLKIENLTVDFKTEDGSVQALRNISLKVNRGEIVAIVGESGSGKSVTSLSVLQLLPVPPANYSGGSILMSANGEDQVDLLHTSREEIRKVRGNEIAMIFQEPMTSLNPVFTCGDQVMEAIRLHKSVSAAEAGKQVIDWFNRVKLPDPESLFSRYPHQLSGGQKQRVMIAMAMSCEPSLLIADEPTTALDVTVQKTILLLIRELQQQFNMGVIFISHDLGVISELADRVIVMYKGRIVEEGTVQQILHLPTHPYTRSLLACRPALHQHGQRLPVVSDFLDISSSGEIIAKMNQPLIRMQEERSESFQFDQPLLSVQNLSVWFPGKKNFFGKPLSFIKAVDDVSFQVFEGETLGLVGESGSGKTTLGRTLLRLVEPRSGTIFFRGKNLLECSPAAMRDLRKQMQIIFQDPYSSLNPRITVGQAIQEPLKIHGMLISEKARKERVISLLEKVDLRPEHYNRYPHEFSGGQRQRIVIARALALNPAFIICDESVSSLDVSVQAQVLNLLNDLKKEFGFTIVFISHDLSVVRYISDRVMVMHQGLVIEMGTAEQIYNNPSTAYTKQLIASLPRQQ